MWKDVLVYIYCHIVLVKALQSDAKGACPVGMFAHLFLSL
jgi:hypothetical protein